MLDLLGRVSFFVFFLLFFHDYVQMEKEEGSRVGAEVSSPL